MFLRTSLPLSQGLPAPVRQQHKTSLGPQGLCLSSSLYAQMTVLPFFHPLMGASVRMPLQCGVHWEMLGRVASSWEEGLLGGGAIEDPGHCHYNFFTQFIQLLVSILLPRRPCLSALCDLLGSIWRCSGKNKHQSNCWDAVSIFEWVESISVHERVESVSMDEWRWKSIACLYSWMSWGRSQMAFGCWRLCFASTAHSATSPNHGIKVSRSPIPVLLGVGVGVEVWGLLP